jgi:hypothetical protein
MNYILGIAAVVFCCLFVYSGSTNDLILAVGFTILSRLEHLIERKTK